MKALVGAFNQGKALVGAFSVIVQPVVESMENYTALHQGLYLSPIGSRAVLKTRSNVVTKDELFSLEDSLPQASFMAAANSRYVSVKQGACELCYYSIYLRNKCIFD